MANRFGVKLQSRLPNLAGFYLFSTPITCTNSVQCCSKAQTRIVGKRRAIRCRNIHRRVVLGIGVSLWSQFMSMAGNVGAKSFVASARQKGAIEQVLKNVEWPEQFPLKDEDFQRFDEYNLLNFCFLLSSDTLFYEMPRFVTHIDDQAIAALTKYYSEVLPSSNTPGVAVLDMCSSWVSHYPAGFKQERIVGMGMNEEELKRNTVLTEYVVQDLNNNPKLPFGDNTFDVITNVNACLALKMLPSSTCLLSDALPGMIGGRTKDLTKAKSVTYAFWLPQEFGYYRIEDQQPVIVAKDPFHSMAFFLGVEFLTKSEYVTSATNYSWEMTIRYIKKKDRGGTPFLHKEETFILFRCSRAGSLDSIFRHKVSWNLLTVSVDYLTKPLDVFKEMSRVLKPGGLAIMSFSNRCFWTKAISIWTSTGDADHVMIVGSYFHYAGGFEPPQAVDISPNPGRSDPMYIVYSRKIATA
ncbi:hypothetical protein MTR67_031372 [Solanum verrucosum]|uniref:Methyltransferase type 11 domain-containing protein n=1 Tax=Solanum verrucosum TaxID=315347 RepID=A0AAF0U2A8_SOLVR|nr:hypothetical protein MTR67_031372 [Solanum verrucosum]